MDQRQRAAPDAQQSKLLPGAVLPLVRRKGRIQQVEAGDHHAPAAQQRPLGQHQVSNDVRPAQIVWRGLVGGGRVVSVQDGLDARPDRQRAVILPAARQVEIIQEAQAAVEEEQQRREDDRLLSGGHLPGQAHHAHVAQRHHQRAGDGQRRLDAPAKEIERGTQAIHQEGVAELHAGKEGILRREGGVLQRGDERHMHRQIAVGRLTDPPGSVVHNADIMGVLQPGRQRRQRQHDDGHLQGESGFVIIPGFHAGLVPQEVRPRRQPRQRDQRQQMPRHGESHREGHQRRQPHHQQQTAACTQPHAGEHALPRQQKAHDGHSAENVRREVQDCDHQETSRSVRYIVI